MCGIVGSIAKQIDPVQLATCAQSLQHRGPNGHGEQVVKLSANQVWLAHTRLAILDLSTAGHQPMQSSSGRWWVSYNGEIYNHLTLRKSLDTAFRGHSDTETLTELISKHGIHAVLPRLNGMFAFAALDKKDEKLYLARDSFGIKPLYYTGSKGKFSFASEIRALVDARLIEPRPDAEGLQKFLSLRYVASPNTLWEGVKRIKPGHVLCLNLKTLHINITHFIAPVNERFTGTMADASRQYEGLLKTAIGRQLRADVPMGLLLSGGIDSALIAAMAKDMGKRLPCFTVGFGDAYAECEISDAEETANVLGLPIKSVRVTSTQLREALPKIIQSVEEPLGTDSIMPMWYLAQRAKQDVTVVLTGQGTDEPWGGYLRYQVEMVRRLMPFGSFWRGIKKIGHVLGGTYADFIERGLRTLEQESLSKRTLEACTLFTAQDRLLLTGSSSDGGALETIQYWKSWLSSSHCEGAESMMRMDTRMNLADDLLLYGDKISMAHSLEARPPMLDIELVRFVESLPIEYRISLNNAKIVHKKMAEHYLPAAIVHRKKRGFKVPFGDWSRGPWRDYIEAQFFSQHSPLLDYLDKKQLNHFWTEHVSKQRDRSRQIFALLTLAIWMQSMT